MIHLDTSILIEAFTGARRSLFSFRAAQADGHRVTFSAIALFEWRRGPRTSAELADQSTLLADADVVPFGLVEAQTAARLYTRVSRPRGREADLAIAATAIVHGAALWTLNRRDFADIPGLELHPAR